MMLRVSLVLFQGFPCAVFFLLLKVLYVIILHTQKRPAHACSTSSSTTSSSTRCACSLPPLVHYCRARCKHNAATRSQHGDVQSDSCCRCCHQQSILLCIQTMIHTHTHTHTHSTSRLPVAVCNFSAHECSLLVCAQTLPHTHTHMTQAVASRLPCRRSSLLSVLLNLSITSPTTLQAAPAPQPRLHSPPPRRSRQSE